jgi:hypothetical protein
VSPARRDRLDEIIPREQGVRSSQLTGEGLDLDER